MALQPYIRPELTFIFDDVESRDDLFRRLAGAVDSMIPALRGEALVQRLIAREKQMPTSTPEGVAFPHALAAEIDKTMVTVALLKPGVSFGVAHHPVSDLIFCMFGPTSDPWDHVRLLARLARIVRAEPARNRLRSSEDANQLYESLLAEDRSHG
ncbi:MAG: PTS sugar transporter subunit IIA [Phycisphaerales bacterium]|nr:PTS sugar transporter subunit IIA [Phycisphaerales bacterium]